MTTLRVQEFAVKSAVLRRAVESHRAWIEQELGISFARAAILETEADLTEIAIEYIFKPNGAARKSSTLVTRLRRRIISATIPDTLAPLLETSTAPSTVMLDAVLLGSTSVRQPALSWRDCPVSLRLRGIGTSIVALKVQYHGGPHSDSEDDANLLVVRREAVPEVMRLLAGLEKTDNKPRLRVIGGTNREVLKCGWDDLTLDPNVNSLLKEDFESFFERQQWFRQNRLPFRRGYLLHGPPGNGKSTAIRAMMSSRGLTAHTLRWFDRRQDDSHLEHLFDEAVKNRPSMVLLEDIDRAFPRDNNSTKSAISLQQLLNCLDGIGTGEGIIVVATANEPTALDPAILRRPGRFDRVIHFPNPSVELRQAYFRRMHPGLAAAEVEQAAAESEGFSFAQLREAYISAGQRAFERMGHIDAEDLLAGVQSLRRSLVSSAARNNSAGF